MWLSSTVALVQPVAEGLLSCLRFIVVSEISFLASFSPNADRFFASTVALFLYPCLFRARLHPAIAPTGSRSQRDEVVPSCTPGRQKS